VGRNYLSFLSCNLIKKLFKFNHIQKGRKLIKYNIVLLISIQYLSDLTKHLILFDLFQINTYILAKTKRLVLFISPSFIEISKTLIWFLIFSLFNNHLVNHSLS
jgi:hypothetical protein